MLEDLVVAAFNDAIKRAEEQTKEKMIEIAQNKDFLNIFGEMQE